MGVFGFKTIKELCQRLQVVTENCSCKALHITTKDGENLEFCDMSPTKPKITLVTIICITSIIGLVGNLLVVWVQVKKAKEVTRYSQLLISLALSDLLFAFLTMLYYVPKIWTDEWVYGLTGCKMLSSAMSLGALIAVGIIQIIAIERFNGLVYPFSKGLGHTTMYCLLSLNIVIGICCVIPRIMHLTVTKEDGICSEHWNDKHDAKDSEIYDWSILFLYSVIPVVTISILYVKIFRTITQSIKQCNDDASGNGDILTAKRLKNSRKTMVLLVAVLVAFVICTFPNKIRWVLLTMIPFDHDKKKLFDTYLYDVTEGMYSFHISINPIIYTIADTRFRRELKLRMAICWNKIKKKASIKRYAFHADFIELN